MEICVLVIISLLLRWSTSQGSYSGQGKPPMFGDYEAQRHWMEVTVNLPVKDWYRNTTENDLLYWGLDYPPLTAYHSQICGFIAQYVNPEWVRLNTSRGHESYQHKLFMRYSVFLADILVFLPACLLYYISQDEVEDKSMIYGLMCLLLYPGLILIDYGHFQYNGISLGLMIMAVASLGLKQQILGAIFFTLALNYKHMELYHALPFFMYLFGVNIHTNSMKGVFQIGKIGVAVILTFMLCWLPFLSDIDSFRNVLIRLFPFNRGLYEDKVANLWCSLSLVIKLKNIMSQQALVVLSFLSTLVGLVPSAFHLLYKPTLTNFKYSLVSCHVNSSLVFFLFSFQVHEKSILIPALSVCLLADKHPYIALWFLSISTFSMLPLLIKDGLLIQCCGLSVVFLILAYYSSQQQFSHYTSRLQNWMKFMFFSSIFGAVILTVCSEVVQPPPRLPDIFPVLISAYSCGHFLFFLFLFHYCQFFNNVPNYVEKHRKVSQHKKFSKEKKVK
ncbi:hypothetical protein LOTGIDRAFT_102561 [Lottia gigantea]|uniref:Alpha-1,3-glucosyltransferase n=1 Tax=Lottia gigantea TaxID=225164 RepID=V4BH17_LOTGI|nr:hypothetical protein LOTGIDRAFT_102561 [Lottia gigantea]ESP05232.1 hypothetical protein LOTGIDRAFT_102561 [Lottia gigantea]